MPLMTSDRLQTKLAMSFIYFYGKIGDEQLNSSLVNTETATIQYSYTRYIVNSDFICATFLSGIVEART